MDLHCDILLRVLENGVDLAHPPTWPQATIPNLLAGNVTEQVFAVWVNSREVRGLDAARLAFRTIDAFQNQLDRYSDRIALVRNTREAAAARAAGRLAIYLWLEGGGMIADDLALLRTFHRLGACGMTLTWADNITWAGSSTDPVDPNRGLTPFGREVVREMDRLRMIVDLSHVSIPTFYEALTETSAPVVCSHSGCRAVADHPRNLDDDQLRTLSKNGGLIGIFAVPEFLDMKWRQAWKDAEGRLAKQLVELRAAHKTSPGFRVEEARLIASILPPEHTMPIDTMLDHLDHAVAIAGIDHVAFGSDFDGTWTFPAGFETPAAWPLVIERLRARGYDEAALRAITGDNARRVFRQVLDS